MKIALVGPELEENLALRYIHASLSRAGHDVRIFDFHAPEQAAPLAAEIALWRPEIVGLSMVFTARAGEYLDLAAGLRQRGFAGHITAGGHFASFHATQLLAEFPALDSVLHGEGEAAMIDLAKKLSCSMDVLGITVRGQDGKNVETPPRPPLDDLDKLPWPSRSLQPQNYLGLPIANVLAGRGCFGNCHFCSINAWHRKMGGKRFRQRSLEDLSAELAWLYHDRGIRIFNFHDDNFFLPRRSDNLRRFGRLKALLDKAGVGRIAIQIKARPDSIDPEIVAALKELGLFRVFLGVESNAVNGLKALGRGIERKQNRAALDALLAAELHVTFNLLMFEPDCSLDDLRQNVDFMRAYRQVPLNFCRVEVYSGTELERRLRGQGRLEGDYFGYNYRIADDRSQLAYEIFRAVFSPRNFLTSGMNLRAMAVDYNLQILRHFFGPAARPALVRQAKGFIGRLNDNNVRLLGEILDFVRRDRHGGTDAFIDKLTARRVGFDAKAAGQVEALLLKMNMAARGQLPTSGLSKAATAAAAVLLVGSLGSTACDPVPPEIRNSRPTSAKSQLAGAAVAPGKIPPIVVAVLGQAGTHYEEMVARPRESQPTSTQASRPTTRMTHPSEMAPPPVSQPTTRTTHFGEMAPRPIQPASRPASRPTTGPIIEPPHHAELAPASLQQSARPGGEEPVFPPGVFAADADTKPANPPIKVELPNLQPVPLPGPGMQHTEMAPPPARPRPPASQPTTSRPALPTSLPGMPFSLPAAYGEAQAERIQAYVQKQYGPQVQQLGNTYTEEKLDIPVILVLGSSGKVSLFKVELAEERYAKLVTAMDKLVAKWEVPEITRPGTIRVIVTIQPRPKIRELPMD